MNQQIRNTLYRFIIPVSIILMTIVFPFLLSFSRPTLDWLIRIFLCVWLCVAFWQVPDPYKAGKSNWWSPVYVNWSEKALRTVFLIQIGGYGIAVSAIVWWLVSYFLHISFPFAQAFALIYGLLFLVGMLPAYPKFKEISSERLE